MSQPDQAPSRAARREARRKARWTRIVPWLAAAILAAAGLILLPGALRPAEGLPAATFAPVVAQTGQDSASAAPDAAQIGPDAASAALDAALAAPDTAQTTPDTAQTTPDTTQTGPVSTPASEATETNAPAAPSPAPSPAAEPVTLILSAAGDCTLGGDASRRTLSAFARAYKKSGPDYFLKNVRDIFAGDDLTIINLEGPLTDEKRFREKEFAFKGDPEYVKILTEGSVEAANLANNHAKDYYGAGLMDTASALKAAGVARFGWGNTEILTIKGIKVGLCGFGVWYVSVKEMEKQIKALKAQCDLVVASIHGGEEGEGRALKVQRNYDRAAVRAGASLVLGHHPHVVGGIEKYQGATIVYSLGNFCFGGNLNPDDKDTFIFQQTFTVGADGLAASGELVIPCSISGSKSKNDYQPVPLTGDDARRVLTRIEKLSKGFDQPVDLTASRERLNAG